ncbi:MAG TPA: hypothetical protein VNL14_23385 [Candidatus Acidoferrales bacterium]|nr:hypothetical protein [Candidatus Acidoferrales bacterium]
MKTLLLSVGVSLLILSGLAFGNEQRGHRSMMEEMMKRGKEGERMGGMMRMMKMMDQCASMTASSHGSEKPRENRQ